MASETALKARRARNSALIETMLLAAIADGKVSMREKEALLRRVFERSEFEGTRPEELAEMVEGAMHALAAAKNLEEVLQSLRARLPDHKNRVLAFGLAAAITFADRRATRAELGILKTFQAALGISEEEVAQVIETVEAGGSLAEALGEPLERLYAEVMVLMTAAEGAAREAEARALVENLIADPVFANVSAERAQAFIVDAVGALASEGLPRRLAVLAHGITTHPQRLMAYRLAARIASASGKVSASEERLLAMLQASFGLADDEVNRIRRES